MRRWALGVVAVALVAVGGWWWLHEGEGAASGDEAPASANEGALPAPRASKWSEPIVQRGSRTLSGVVLRDGQPVSGAVVTALAAHGDDVLSDLPCQCDNHCGQKLLACGCAEASGQLVELVGARTGESVPLGRATSGADGTFTIEGLDDSRLTLWADAPGVIGWATDVASDARDVKVHVTPGRTIKGKVTTSKDTPASGALVTAIFAEQSRFFETTTHADGTFELGPMPRGKYAVVAMQEGLLPDHAQADDSKPELAMELSVPRALTGTVLLDGKPVAAAKVKLEGMHRKRTVFTDGNGVFHLERLRPGKYDLTAEGSGALGTVKAEVNKREDRAGVVIELVRGVPLDGVVLDERGEAVPGVKLTIERTGSDWAHVESDAEGRFHLDTVPEGPRALVARKPGFLSDEELTVTGGGAPVTVTLRHAAVLSGRVQTADGVLVPEFSIRARLADAGTRSRDAYDDFDGERLPVTVARADVEDGGFSLDLMPGEFEVMVNPEKFITETVTLRAPASEVVITVRAGGSIRGTLVDADNAPVVGASVFASFESSMKDARTDEAGQFELAGLVAGKWKVTGRPEYAAKHMWSVTAEVEVSLGKETSLTLRPPVGAPIDGVVLDGAGNPVRDAHVSGVALANDKDDKDDEAPPAMEMTSTDEVGGFRLRTLPAGKVELRAGTKDANSKPLTITAPDAHVILKLEEGTTVSGRVVDDSGKPVKEFKVTGRPFDAEDGRFKLRWRAGKKQSLAIDAIGFAQHIFDVDVNEGANELGDIKLSRGLKLTGLVFDEKTKAPIAGALVDVSTSRPEGGVYLSESRGAVRTDAQGRYAIVIDPASTWAVATHENYVRGIAQIPFGGATVDIALRAGAEVTVSLVDAQGQPVTDGRVWAASPSNTKEFDAAKPPGTWVARAFAPGEWVFRAQTRGDRIVFERVVATVGEAPQSLVLHEQTGGVDIAVSTPTPVKVMLLTAGHVSVADFEARMMTGDLTRITNGVAKHVQPGAWTIIATDGKQLALHPIDVTASGPTRVEFTPTWQPIPR